MALAWSPGYRQGESDPTTVYTFTATVAQPRSIIKENVTRHLVVTVSGNTVIHVSGDVSEIQSFDIPENIKRGLAELLSDAAASLLHDSIGFR